MKFFQLLLGALLVSSCVSKDDESPEPSDVFIKYFGESGEHMAVDMVFNETYQEYLMLGSQDLGGATGSDFYFVKASSNGNLIEAVSKGFTDSLGTELIDYPKKLVQLDDDRYLVIGTSSNTDEESKIVWAIINHDLNLDNATFHEITNAGNDLEAVDILKVNDEDAVFVLGSASTLQSNDLVSASTAGRQFFMTKRSLSDNSDLWGEPRTTGVAGDDIPVKVFERAAGGFAIFGSTEEKSGDWSGHNVRVLFTNTFGEVDVSSVFGVDASETVTNLDQFDDMPYDVYDTGFGYKLVGGSSLNGSNHQSFFMDISNQANLVRSSHLTNDFELNSQAFAITRSFGGNYIVMGSYNSFQTQATDSGIEESRLEEAMVMQVDAFGQRIVGMDEYYGLESGNDRAVRAITLSGSGDVVMLGTFDFGSGISLIGLIKFNSQGELN